MRLDLDGDRDTIEPERGPRRCGRSSRTSVDAKHLTNAGPYEFAPLTLAIKALTGVERTSGTE